MFQSWIGLHRAFEPWKRVDSVFFDGSACLREIFLNAPLYSSDSRGGQKKWDGVGRVFVPEWYGPVRLFDIQGHLSWHLFYEKMLQRIALGKKHSDIDVLMSPFAPKSTCSWLNSEALASISYFLIWYPFILWVKCVIPGWQKRDLILPL